MRGETVSVSPDHRTIVAAGYGEIGGMKHRSGRRTLRQPALLHGTLVGERLSAS
jgi:hypothetical protein